MLDEEGIAGSPFPPRDAITESPLTGHALPNVDPNAFRTTYWVKPEQSQPFGVLPLHA